MDRMKKFIGRVKDAGLVLFGQAEIDLVSFVNKKREIEINERDLNRLGLWEMASSFTPGSRAMLSKEDQIKYLHLVKNCPINVKFLDVPDLGCREMVELFEGASSWKNGQRFDSLSELRERVYRIRKSNGFYVEKKVYRVGESNDFYVGEKGDFCAMVDGIYLVRHEIGVPYRDRKLSPINFKDQTQMVEGLESRRSKIGLITYTQGIVLK